MVRPTQVYLGADGCGFGIDGPGVREQTAVSDRGLEKEVRRIPTGLSRLGGVMKRTEIDEFEKLNAQLEGLHQEMSVLAKKSPNDAVNAFKIKLVNTTIDRCNKLLGEKYKPFAEFQTFETDELPSNSDVTFIVSQYIECAEKFRADNIFMEHGRWYWQLDGGKDEIRTSAPKKLNNK